MLTSYPKFAHYEEMESLELERIQVIKQGIIIILRAFPFAQAAKAAKCIVTSFH